MKRLAVILIGLGFAALSLADGKKIALLIGVNDYADPSISDLHFAQNDVEQLGLTLEAQGFKTMRLTTAAGPNSLSYPSRDSVKMALAGLSVQLSADDTFLFFFSGHGFSDSTKKAYFATADTKVSDLAGTAMAVSDVMDLCRNIKAGSKLFVFDACRNIVDDDRKYLTGVPLEERGVKGAQSLNTSMSSDFEHALKSLSEVPGAAVLASCKYGEESYELIELSHGVFTYFLIEGLKGAAANADKTITAESLSQYVKSQVPKKKKEQNPWSLVSGSTVIQLGSADSVMPSALGLDSFVDYQLRPHQIIYKVDGKALPSAGSIEVQPGVHTIDLVVVGEGAIKYLPEGLTSQVYDSITIRACVEVKKMHLFTISAMVARQSNSIIHSIPGINKIPGAGQVAGSQDIKLNVNAMLDGNKLKAKKSGDTLKPGEFCWGETSKMK